MMYQKRRFQNKVAESSFLLPAAVLIYLLLWLIGDVSYPAPTAPACLGEQLVDWINQWSNPLTAKITGLFTCALCTVQLVELNNKNVLLRVRSRMTSSSVLIVWSTLPFLHQLQLGHLILLCFLIIYQTLFKACQRQNATTLVFQAFTSLGVGCILFPPLVAFIPFLFIAFAYFKALTFRSFFAGILGLVLPCWLLFSYSFLMGDICLLIANIREWIVTPSLNYQSVNSHQWLSLGFIFLLALIGGIHFLQNNYQDKIRVRMLYYCILAIELFLFSILLLLPDFFNTFFLLFITNSCLLIAHYFTLTNKRFTNILFIIVLILLFILAVYNIWMPSYNFF